MPASMILDQPATARAEATRAAIVETAERLFRGMGYRKTAVADIARELSMSPANVYRFFPSKAAINEAITARLLGGLDREAWAVATGPDPAADRIVALFRLLAERTRALCFDAQRMHDMIEAAMNEHWSVIDPHLAQIDAALAHIVTDGQRAGTFTADLDPAQTGCLLHQAITCFCHPTLVEQKARSGHAAGLPDAMAAFCLRALRA